MKLREFKRIRKVSKKTIADFIRSESGSVGIRNAAIIGVSTGALALSQSSSNAIVNGDIVDIIVAT
ncbi:MAG: hypothetical protein OXU36_22765 [Candidatus Poribacteria bacterium]|nr:hypothetical protein [Candidatus Poribacteria bacterium]